MFRILYQVVFVLFSEKNIHLAAKPAAAPAAKAEPPIPRKRTNRTPIIIIPGGMAGTLINMYNVRDILQVVMNILNKKEEIIGYDV